MKLTNQKRIAAKLLKVGINRVLFDETKLKEIKEAITKEDIRALIKDGAIKARQKKGISSFRSKKIKIQKRKGRKQGIGSRGGRRKARLSKKRRWMQKVRAQRKLIKLLKNKKLITTLTYSKLCKKVKGNFFRSRRHIKLFLDEHNLILKQNLQKPVQKVKTK